MKRKILSVILSFTMIFSTTGLVFADTDVDNQIEPTKTEKEIEKAPSQEKSRKRRRGRRKIKLKPDLKNLALNFDKKNFF